MEETRRPPLAHRESWIVWGFLYVALVVLPTGVAWWQADAWLTEDRALLLARASSMLESRGMAIRTALEPRSVLQQMALGLRELSARQFQGWAARFGKHLPNAARWVAWDDRGDLIPLPPDLALPGTRRWQGMVRTFFLNPGAPEVQPADVRQRIAEEFQPLLGPRLRAEDLLSARMEPFPGEFLGKTCLVYWTNWNQAGGSPPATAAASPRPPRRVAGFLAVIFVDALPDHFWSRMAFQGFAPPEFRDAAFPLGLLTYNGKRRQRFQPPLSARRGFGRQLAEALERSAAPHVLVGDWLGVPVLTSPERNEQVLVFRDLRQDLDTSRASFRLLKFAVCLVLLGGLAAAVLFRRGVGLDLSLQWRIAGYFLAAVGLPMFGLVQGTILLGQQQLERVRETTRLRMQDAARVLDRRLADSLPAHSLAIARRIEALASGARSLPALNDRLQDLIRERAIANFFLSDPEGRLVFQGDKKVDRYLLSILKVILQNEATAGRGLPPPAAGKPSLGELMTDEVGEGGQVSEAGEGNVLSRPGRWNRFRLSRTDVRLMKCLVWLEGIRHALILTANEPHFEYACYRREIAAQRFASADPRASLELACHSHAAAIWPHLPPASPICLNPQVAPLLDAEGEVLQEVTGQEESFLVYSPARRTPIYRPVFYASLTRAFGAVEARRRQLVFTAVAALAVALLLGVLLADRLLVPIRRIDGALGLVAGGDLHVELPVESGDEIGHISRTFNQMVKDLRERKRLQAYVSDTVREAVKDSAEARWQAGEVVEATILFSDIRGFTTLCEAHSPRDMFAMLNAFLGGVEPVLARFGGEIDKFIGDAVMAVFRTPGPDQALQAVRAALAMREFLAAFNRERQAAGRFPIAIGVGISTGRVMQGDVGSDRRKDLTVIGDEVNLAARLETASKEGVHTQIIIAENTWRLVRDRVEAVEMARTTVKGKQQAVRMFEVIGLRSPEGRG